MLAFFGAAAGGKPPLLLTFGGLGVLDIALDPGTASATIQLLRNGDAVGVRANGADITPVDEWIAASRKTSTIGDDFEVRATLVTGSISTGTTGSWLRLDSTRSWNCSQVSPGSIGGELRFEFRRFGGSAILYTSPDINISTFVA